MAKLLPVMKAPNEQIPFDDPRIKYPLYASTKFDGFRCVNLCGEHLMSPAMKPFPNVNLHLMLKNLLRGCELYRIVTDGEIWSPTLTFQQLQSVVRSQFEPIPDSVAYYIFDIMSEDEWDGQKTSFPFVDRYTNYIKLTCFEHVVPVHQQLVPDAETAQRIFEQHIERNEEGIILKSPSLGYKHGRTTHRESWMYKFKQFVTHDAVIVGVEERQVLRDDVERTLSPLGNPERVHTQEAYVPCGMVGAFVLDWKGREFRVKPGRGFSHQDLRLMWEQRTSLVGKVAEFKYMPKGTMDLPRIGSLVRIREDLQPMDLNEEPICG